MFFMLQYIFLTFDFIYSLLDFQLLLGLIGYIKLIFFNPIKQNITTKNRRKISACFSPFSPLTFHYCAFVQYFMIKTGSNEEYGLEKEDV